MSLDDIDIGEIVIIDKILFSKEKRKTMFELGFTKGTYIQIVKKGDNLNIYNLRGSNLAIRRNDAKCILVSII